MSPATESVYSLDLNPRPGFTYFNCEREWHEEFIYFLMVDRFDDGRPRQPSETTARSSGSGDLPRLQKFCGGTLQGVTKRLDYIKGLGCTSIWISPIFENSDAPSRDSDKYHGYSIQNYLEVDPRFGTKQDLVDLVGEAHRRNMRVFLDVVLNHSGDNWSYPGDFAYRYWNDVQFPFGQWRRSDRPLPIELRDPALYHRRGEIQNYDALPEARHGDFMSLKDYNNSENPDGLRLIDILARAHCWWIKEADIDGFRLDAVKHMGPKAIARFCTAFSEYAHLLGKRNFFTFGELIAGDDAINRYTGPNTKTDDPDNVFFGLSSVLDFPLSFVLPGTIKGWTSPNALKSRYDALSNDVLTRGELGRYLVAFLDNHDGVGQDPKRRFGADAPDEQIIGGVGYLLTTVGTPCIYYGTEQGFSGCGESDAMIREAAFDLDNPQRTLLNPNCRIYQEISKIAEQFHKRPELRFGRIYGREISGNGTNFGPPYGHPCTLAFSRILSGTETLVAYNTSTTDARNDHVTVDRDHQAGRPSMQIVYSSACNTGKQVQIKERNGRRSVQLSLAPMECVILN